MRSVLTLLIVGLALLFFSAPAPACDYGVGALGAYRQLGLGGGCDVAPLGAGYAAPLRLGLGAGYAAPLGVGYAAPLRFGLGAGYAAQVRFGGRAVVRPVPPARFRLRLGLGY